MEEPSIGPSIDDYIRTLEQSLAEKKEQIKQMKKTLEIIRKQMLSYTFIKRYQYEAYNKLDILELVENYQNVAQSCLLNFFCAYARTHKKLFEEKDFETIQKMERITEVFNELLVKTDIAVLINFNGASKNKEVYIRALQEFLDYYHIKIESVSKF